MDLVDKLKILRYGQHQRRKKKLSAPNSMIIPETERLLDVGCKVRDFPQGCA
jgi:hypothetical protein